MIIVEGNQILFDSLGIHTESMVALMNSTLAILGLGLTFRVRLKNGELQVGRHCADMLVRTWYPIGNSKTLEINKKEKE